MIPWSKNNNSLTLSKGVFLFFIIFCGQRMLAQTPHSFLFEPGVSVNFSTESPWSYSLSVANRALLIERIDGKKVSGYENVHLEVSPFVKYKTTENSAVSLGFRYRFREMYEDSREDRFKFVEEYKYSHPNSPINLSHRARMEQKFRKEGKGLSFRYRLGVSQTLSEVFSIGLSTEALYHLMEQSKPEAEQRFTLEFVNTSLENMELSLGFEYRMDNYNNSLENNYFLLTGIAYDL